MASVYTFQVPEITEHSYNANINLVHEEDSDMIRTKVVVDTNIKHAGSINEAKTKLAELREWWGQNLAEATKAKAKDLAFLGMDLAEKNSDNFQVIGTLFRLINQHLHMYDYPETVTIVCKDEETATMYKVVYNYYIADSKASRMQDKNWD